MAWLVRGCWCWPVSGAIIGSEQRGNEWPLQVKAGQNEPFQKKNLHLEKQTYFGKDIEFPHNAAASLRFLAATVLLARETGPSRYYEHLLTTDEGERGKQHD